MYSLVRHGKKYKQNSTLLRLSHYHQVFAPSDVKYSNMIPLLKSFHSRNTPSSPPKNLIPISSTYLSLFFVLFTRIIGILELFSGVNNYTPEYLSSSYNITAYCRHQKNFLKNCCLSESNTFFLRELVCISPPVVLQQS